MLITGRLRPKGCYAWPKAAQLIGGSEKSKSWPHVMSFPWAWRQEVTPASRVQGMQGSRPEALVLLGVAFQVGIQRETPGDLRARM